MTQTGSGGAYKRKLSRSSVTQQKKEVIVANWVDSIFKAFYALNSFRQLKK